MGQPAFQSVSRVLSRTAHKLPQMAESEATAHKHPQVAEKEDNASTPESILKKKRTKSEPAVASGMNSDVEGNPVPVSLPVPESVPVSILTTSSVLHTDPVPDPAGSLDSVPVPAFVPVIVPVFIPVTISVPSSAAVVRNSCSGFCFFSLYSSGSGVRLRRVSGVCTCFCSSQYLCFGFFSPYSSGSSL